MYQKIAAALLVVAGVGLTATGGYLVVSDNGATGGGRSGDPLVGHVPADTIAFTGYTDTTLPIREISSLWGELEGLASVNAASPKAASDEGGPGVGLLARLYNAYMASLTEDERLLGRFGTLDGDGLGLYAVGALPVLRVSIEQPDAFWQQIDSIESEAGISANSNNRDDTRLRRYRLGNKDDAAAQLVVATHDRDAVITFDGPGINDDALALALGERQPESSLADSGQLSAVADTHGLQAGATGFIDHERIVAGLTGASGSRFGDMLGAIASARSESGAEPSLATIRTSACRQDARAIAAQWPHTAVGLTEIDSDQRRFQTRLAVAGSNQGVMETVQALRGHVPQATTAPAMLELGVGLNIQQLVPTLKDLAQRFTTGDYKCQVLRQAQQQISSQPIGQLGMVTAMLGDIRGVGAAIMGVEPGSGPAPVTGDAVVEIATPEPKALWQSATSTLGLTAKGEVTSGGDPVAVSGGIPLPPDVNLRVALRENTLMILTGQADPGDAAGESDLEANGLLRISYDYAALAAAAEAGGADRMGGKEAARAIKALKGFDVRYTTELDATADDLRLDIGLQAKPET
jgi:hypothetical protein